MNYSSLDSSHWDESNSGGFITLASIERETVCVKGLKRFGVTELYIDARGMNLSPFDASWQDESNELRHIFIWSIYTF
jgi:hypothetical protein